MTVLSQPPMFESDPELREPSKRPRRTWADKFRVAWRGVKFGVRGQSSFFVHFFFAALVVAAAIALRCDTIEWCLLVGCIGFVLVTEMLNSAIETLFRGLDEHVKARSWPALDIAAGAVLLSAITAAVIGSIIFLNRLWVMLEPLVY